MNRSVRIALALSGWIALLATALPAAGPLRTVLTAAFVLVCPGAAVLRPALSPRAADAGGRTALDLLEDLVLTPAVSLALAVLVAQAFLLNHAFTVPRALGVLAVVTTVAALWPGRRGPRRPARADAAGPAGGGERSSGGRPPGAAPTAPRAALPRAGTAGVLLLATACTGGGVPALSGSTTGGGPPVPVAAAATAPAAAGPWRLVLQDDFNGTELDTARWARCYDWNDGGCTNAGNHEAEWYLPGQVSVGDGAATLTAARRDTVGSDGKTYPWTSGMITTGRDSWNATPRETFTHGYFAAALRIPPQSGMFPAFWLMPDTRTTPPELDVAEFAGSTQQVSMNVHWRGADGSDQHVGHNVGPVDFPAATHVFAMDWEPGAITWYVDGVQQWRVTDPQQIPDVPMELLVNLAVGYPSAPPASVNSAALTVDWVRVWQH
ncbi:family 16 glycosylhydrolase [Kitasatospora sp. NBC_01266]|uniref:family 16 glycosylhydrolase n=1 Tax=Kitasatospora sp. NBC_01266 TaxID=2903572 RepID=UPI002E2ED0DF|nr:family 16 glycosylhydrolase [Kitasatospora sp. NBC_01266]